MLRISVLATPLCLNAATPAGGLDLSWHTIDGGGGVSSGGGFTLSGTIGQHDAGAPMTVGGLSLAGGFWGFGGGAATCPADVAPPPDGDTLVNVDDLLLVINSWGSQGAGDVNGDGLVNVDDLLAVINAWGFCPG